jgi:enoyl-CoA hydratase
MSDKNIIIEKENGIITASLNRPDALNALNDELMDELLTAVDNYEKDDSLRCMILTGSSKAFAAGADIKQMQPKSYMDVYKEDFITRNWERVASCRKPIIAAVSGYALGGGCELAMMCDFILASESAKFGQPEINLGVSPGAGGSQRLTRFIGKSKAMDMCLTGRMMDAEESERSGLVSRVFPNESFMKDVMEVAIAVSQKSMIATMMTKEMVNRSYETTLSEGIRFERRLFHSMFATEDKKEGMSAFIEKRKPEFKDK